MYAEVHARFIILTHDCQEARNVCSIRVIQIVFGVFLSYFSLELLIYEWFFRLLLIKCQLFCLKNSLTEAIKIRKATDAVEN